MASIASSPFSHVRTISKSGSELRSVAIRVRAHGSSSTITVLIVIAHELLAGWCCRASRIEGDLSGHHGSGRRAGFDAEGVILRIQLLQTLARVRQAEPFAQLLTGRQAATVVADAEHQAIVALYGA